MMRYVDPLDWNMRYTDVLRSAAHDLHSVSSANPLLQLTRHGTLHPMALAAIKAGTLVCPSCNGKGCPVCDETQINKLVGAQQGARVALASDWASDLRPGYATGRAWIQNDSAVTKRSAA
jgi:hypothetical protein